MSGQRRSLHLFFFALEPKLILRLHALAADLQQHRVVVARKLFFIDFLDGADTTISASEPTISKLTNPESPNFTPRRVLGDATFQIDAIEYDWFESGVSAGEPDLHLVVVEF